MHSKKRHLRNINKKYRDENKETLLEKQRQRYKNNINEARRSGKERARKRRAKKAEVNENFTSAQEQITRKAFYNKCFKCKSTKTLTIDHHRALSKGHPLTLDNAVLLCQFCNSSKGAKNPEKFYGIKKCKKLDLKLSKIANTYTQPSGI